MLKYDVTIDGHRVMALIDQFGQQLSRLYIDGEFCDIYDPFNYNPWKDDELWRGFHSPTWKTILVVHSSGKMESQYSLSFKYDPAETLCMTVYSVTGRS